MKALKFLSPFVLLLCSVQLFAQTDKAAKLIADKHFVFNATSVLLNNNDISNILTKMPGNTGGSSVNLNGSQYNLTVTPDSIVAYLPYYGRAYSADVNPNNGGIKFNSKKFTYQNIKRKKGGWQITINTQDARENFRLSLSVSEKGYATLVAIGDNKQAITYNGVISEPEK